jgi:hypothetical protein
MRASRSVSGLIFVALAAVGGCRPAEETVVVAPPEPQAPDPAPPRSVEPPPALEPATLTELVSPVQEGPSQQAIDQIRESTRTDRAAADSSSAALPARVVDRLVYQCVGDVTFAIRIAGEKLLAFPPGYSNGYIILERVASDDGVHYASRGADFVAKDDLATLQVEGARYADCVSNPAAALWQTLPRTPAAAEVRSSAPNRPR